MLNYDSGLEILENASLEFTSSFSNLILYLTMATSYFGILSFICISIGSFVLLIVILSIVMFSCRAKDKCHFTSCMTNTCNALLGLSSFLLSIVVIVFVAINFVTASMCDYSYDASVNPNVSDDIRGYFSKNLEGLLSSECLETDGLKLTQYIDINDPGLIDTFNQIGTFLDGFSYYDNFLLQLPADSYNNNYVKISEEWEKYRIGEKFSFENTVGKNFKLFFY